MSQSIDFRINDLINEYLDYKGYSRTVETFHEERQVRQEPIDQTLNGNSSNKERVKVLHIKVDDSSRLIASETFSAFLQDTMLQHFDRGHREEFFQLWHEHIRSDLVDQDPSLKSLEFLLYTHFAIYHLRSDRVGDSI